MILGEDEPIPCDDNLDIKLEDWDHHWGPRHTEGKDMAFPRPWIHHMFLETYQQKNGYCLKIFRYVQEMEDITTHPVGSPL